MHIPYYCTCLYYFAVSLVLYLLRHVSLYTYATCICICQNVIAIVQYFHDFTKRPNLNWYRTVTYQTGNTYEEIAACTPYSLINPMRGR